MQFGDYRDWTDFDYLPATRDAVPAALAPFLLGGERVLDVGCHHGVASRFLEALGARVLGIDINANAIATAERNRGEPVGRGCVEFRVADVITADFLGPGSFDVVVLNRFLTCMPQHGHWARALERAFALLADGGLIYVNDFLYMDDCRRSLARYRDAEACGMRRGNLVVGDDEGNARFVAHHQLPAEVEAIAAPYLQLVMRAHETRSRHGHPSRMFEFVGRKPGGPGLSSRAASDAPVGPAR